MSLAFVSKVLMREAFDERFVSNVLMRAALESISSSKSEISTLVACPSTDNPCMTPELSMYPNCVRRDREM